MKLAKLQRFLRNQRGFSFTELLATVIVVTLATTVLAAGIPSAIDAYGNLMDVANSQTLISTTATVLRQELSMATDVSVSNDKKTVSYTSDATGAECTIEIVSPSTEGADSPKNNELMLKSTLTGNVLRRVAPEGASSGKDAGSLYVTCESIEQLSEDKPVICFTNLEVHKKIDNGQDKKMPVSIASFDVRLLADDWQ